MSVCQRKTAPRANPFLCDKHHAPQTNRWITVVLQEGGASWGREPIKYHICNKMPYWGSQHRPCYFKDAYLKLVDVRALHSGLAPCTASIIYGLRLHFTGLPLWGGCGSHHRCLMMSQAREDSWECGVRSEPMWRLKAKGKAGRQWHYNTSTHWSFSLLLQIRLELPVSPLASLHVSYQWIAPSTGRKNIHRSVKNIEISHLFGWFGHCSR